MVVKKNMKPCQNKLVIDKDKPIIYFCVREKGHKGKHKSYFGYPTIKKIIWWENK
jgi:hypothetical protein